MIQNVKMAPTPVHVMITGAAGQIGYALAPMVARGAMLGSDQPVVLHLLDIEPAAQALEGVKMELLDAAFPLLHGMFGAGKPAQHLLDWQQGTHLVGAKWRPLPGEQYSNTYPPCRPAVPCLSFATPQVWLPAPTLRRPARASTLLSCWEASPARRAWSART